MLIKELAGEYSKHGRWHTEIEALIWSETSNSILNALDDCGFWMRHFVALTTGCPEEDLELSRTRQILPSRDPRLATIDHLRLCAYLAALRGIVEHIKSAGFTLMLVHPAKPAAEVACDIIAGWPLCDHS